MQLLALALYGPDGRRRVVDFRPAALNIVTGESKTGKSAMLTITEYCLGRSTYLVPEGPITRTALWYGSLWQLTDDPDGPRAFVGRPAPKPGVATNSQAMLELGGRALGLYDYDQLDPNSNVDAVRQQLGRRIGIAENLIESRQPGMNQVPFEAHLGHAAWLCLQDQDEIASRTNLFHRTNDPKVAAHLKDTLPYFLGALPVDAAAKKAALRDAQRQLRRVESALANAQRESAELDTTLQGLLSEAHAAGLTPVRQFTNRTEIIAVLHAIRYDRGTTRTGGETEQPAPPRSEPADVETARDGTGPIDAQDRRRALEAQRSQLRRDLEETLEQRALLLAQTESESEYTQAIALHTGRLTSLELLPAAPEPSEEHTDGAGQTAATEACPVCGQGLPDADPTVDDINGRLTELRSELAQLNAAPASRRKARTEIEDRADQLRRELSAADGALLALDEAAQAAAQGAETDTPGALGRDAAARQYTRGRIDALLGVIATASEHAVQRLQRAAQAAAERIELLEAELEGDDSSEQLYSRMNIIGQSMTEYAEKLALEHSANGVRLDLKHLTVVTDTSDGPLPLSRIGSAANWIGYHLATHLAMHKFFVENDRPVPRFLMLDQPTQAYYPSETAKRTGQPEDADRAAVATMFSVMRDMVGELAPRMQIIVCDHANLEEAWFQDRVVHNWRSGVKLVPSDWIGDDAG